MQDFKDFFDKKWIDQQRFNFHLTDRDFSWANKIVSSTGGSVIYDEEEDSLSVFIPLCLSQVYDDQDKLRIFPISLVEKEVNKQFSQSNRGLYKAGKDLTGLGLDNNPFYPTISDPSTGYYELNLDFPNVSKMDQQSLSTRINEFNDKCQIIAKILEDMQN